jgi:hypothetical protein
MMPQIRSWPRLTPDLARTVLDIYATDPPRTSEERRHLKAARTVLNQPTKITRRISALPSPAPDAPPEPPAPPC